MDILDIFLGQFTETTSAPYGAIFISMQFTKYLTERFWA